MERHSRATPEHGSVTLNVGNIVQVISEPGRQDVVLDVPDSHVVQH